MNIHHYSIDAQQLMDATTKFYNAFKMQIWLGEIGCQVGFLLCVIKDGV
jgi:hypothetical protein